MPNGSSHVWQYYVVFTEEPQDSFFPLVCYDVNCFDENFPKFVCAGIGEVTSVKPVDLRDLVPREIGVEKMPKRGLSEHYQLTAYRCTTAKPVSG